jgi:uncharacterized caspase-like protein
MVTGLLALGLPAAAQASPEKRVALVIGNGAYQQAPLANPVNDAADLSAALRRLGFEVLERRNRNSEELKRDLIEFQDKLGPGAVGLFYFAGHGVQAGRGQNYLLPVGVDYRRERDAELFGLEAGSVLRRMEESGTALSIVILDACRDSPLPAEARSSGSRGLTRMEAPSGSLIAFATAPGSTADENRIGRNGLYTQFLLRAIETPGLRLEDVFQQVRRDVERASNRRQSPEEISKLTSAFFFRPSGPAGVPNVTAAVATRPPGAAAGSLSLADLEREEQVRREWSGWQQRMRAEFDRVGAFQGSPGLQVQAWQRFLEAWKEDNPLSADDEALRQQAQIRILEAQRDARGGASPAAAVGGPACASRDPWVLEETTDNKILRQCGTGLLWMRMDNGRSVNWSQAQSYCQSLGGGKWSLPTVEQLQSLYRAELEGVTCGSYTCKVSNLFRLSRFWFWSAEQDGSSGAWRVALTYGYRGSGHVGGNTNYAALCVRRP